MVRSLLALVLLISLEARADLFGTDDESVRTNALPALIEKLKGLKMDVDPSFDETFNQNVKEIENAVEAEKLFCAGEAADKAGKTLPPAQKQLCMRELKKSYVSALDVIFEMKKKYLGLIHERQMQKLGEVQQKIKTDIDKNF